MDFLSSQTMKNLARSFAGESQARNRYTFYAQQARHQNQEYLARIFETTADNERAHAEEFLEKLQKYGAGHLENVEFDAGYPYEFSANTADNLRYAAEGELDEHQRAYPAFADIAQQEGYADVAALWRNIAVVEGLHHNVFEQARQQLEDGSLFQKSQPTVWRCINCGYIYSAEQAYEQCPVCGKPRGWAEGDIDEKQLSS